MPTMFFETERMSFVEERMFLGEGCMSFAEGRSR